MQASLDMSIHPQTVPAGASAADLVATGDYRIIRRNGAVVAFEPGKISIAMTEGLPRRQRRAGRRIRARARTGRAADRNVVAALVRRQPSGGTFHIEDMQDQVELALMRSGEHDVARAYVLYRDKPHGRARAAKEAPASTRPTRRSSTSSTTACAARST